ncbi:MAG: cupin domain-containing protein, partial [Candidatus Riflebacteria bacterium]|nr:cupin domain-containing protein [Candidatus Riflebacteria bacterium]
WCYNAGSTVELWIINSDGKLIIRKCGITEDAEPTIYIPSDAIFASRHSANCNDGTFITAITVPRFKYEGFELFSKEEILKKYPFVSSFWE